MPSPVFVAVAALLTLSACARSSEVAHTPGEIPRDGNGRPVWSLIDPSPTPRAS